MDDIWGLVAPSDLDLIKSYRERREKGEDVPESYEFEGVRKDGLPVWVICSVRHVLWEGERAVQATLIDVTKRHLAETRSRELNEQIERSRRMEALGTLAGGVAHDINNALVPIIGLSELLQDELAESPESTDCIGSILDSAEHIRRLADRILAFSRSEGGVMQDVDLCGLVAGALDLLRSTLPSFVQITQDLPGVPLLVRGDPTKLVQVVMNLMTNAAYAIGASTGSIRVSLTGAAEAHLCIADSGSGIAEDVIDRIFDPFFTTKPVGEGTGLGLSVVHGIVTAHGGSISAANNPDRGARFDIRLPLLSSGDPNSV